MSRENTDRLFEYLRSTLYGAEPPSLDLGALDEEHQKLGMGLVMLNKFLREMRGYSHALATGNLSAIPPKRENPLCENLKGIHSNLNHLTWQAKQVAKGDYSQTVSYLGEFSEAFNSMTAQLREREESLRREAFLEKKHSEMADKYNKLLLTMIRRSHEDILVTAAQPPRILFSTSIELTQAQNEELFRMILQRQQQGLLSLDGDAPPECTWEAKDPQNRFYRIVTCRMEWDGEPAYGHTVFEVTREKHEHGLLEREAYFDNLTQISNRFHFFKLAVPLLESGQSLAVCYCDLDQLKYVNDTYGHAEGDRYLCRFTELVRARIREYDVFARLGGDEFCLVLPNCSAATAQKKMLSLQQAFAALPAAPNAPYERMFSFGVAAAEKNHGIVTIDSLLQQADAAMYAQKRCHQTGGKA